MRYKKKGKKRSEESSVCRISTNRKPPTASAQVLVRRKFYIPIKFLWTKVR